MRRAFLQGAEAFLRTTSEVSLQQKGLTRSQTLSSGVASVSLSELRQTSFAGGPQFLHQRKEDRKEAELGDVRTSRPDRQNSTTAQRARAVGPSGLQAPASLGVGRGVVTDRRLCELEPDMGACDSACAVGGGRVGWQRWTRRSRGRSGRGREGGPGTGDHGWSRGRCLSGWAETHAPVAGSGERIRVAGRGGGGAARGRLGRDWGENRRRCSWGRGARGSAKIRSRCVSGGMR